MNRITLRASLIGMLGSTLGIATTQAQDIVLKNEMAELLDIGNLWQNELY